MQIAHTTPASSIRGSSERKSRAAVRLALCAFFTSGSFLVAAPADAAVTSHNGTCTEPDGRTFRVDYTYDSQSGVVQATNILVRNAGSSTFATFNDSSTLVSKLEWWSPNTFNAFVNPTPEGYSFAFVTLAGDQAGYDAWWGARDGRAKVLAQPVFAFLNPRLEFRSNNNPLSRDVDSCDIFLAPYSAGSGSNPRRVAHIGDSISDQMAPKLTQLNFLAGRRYFIDPQSGQSYRSMIGEARGIAAGIRDVNGIATRPDVLVIALGTNDVGSALFATDFNAWRTGLSWILARMLIDTANVPCRVLMTARDSGRDQGHDTNPDGSPGPSWSNSTLAAAADTYNQMIRDTVTNNPSAFRLVDWNQLAATHRPGQAAEWFSLSPFGGGYDRTHPNTAGLDALSGAILQAENSCLGQ